jgi:nucleoside 2-deoxyribosyltransferase
MHIVLCGSMSAAASMIRLSNDLQSRGHMVTLPENSAAHAKGFFRENAEEKKELDVFKKYFAEIQKADAILVCNEKKGEVPNYIGPNTLIEMAFAYVLEKEIYVWNDLPAGSFRDEIEAMHPIVLRASFDSLSL